MVTSRDDSVTLDLLLLDSTILDSRKHMADNKMRESIDTQRTKIMSKMRDIGFAPPVRATTSFVSPCIYYGSKINDSGTWTGPLADDQAEDTRTDVDSLWKAFNDFVDELEEAYKAESPTVDKDDKRATWETKQS